MPRLEDFKIGDRVIACEPLHQLLKTPRECVVSNIGDDFLSISSEGTSVDDKITLWNCVERDGIVWSSHGLKNKRTKPLEFARKIMHPKLFKI